MPRPPQHASLQHSSASDDLFAQQLDRTKLTATKTINFCLKRTLLRSPPVQFLSHRAAHAISKDKVMSTFRPDHAQRTANEPRDPVRNKLASSPSFPRKSERLLMRHKSLSKVILERVDEINPSIRLFRLTSGPSGIRVGDSPPVHQAPPQRDVALLTARSGQVSPGRTATHLRGTAGVPRSQAATMPSRPCWQL